MKRICRLSVFTKISIKHYLSTNLLKKPKGEVRINIFLNANLYKLFFCEPIPPLPPPHCPAQGLSAWIVFIWAAWAVPE